MLLLENALILEFNEFFKKISPQTSPTYYVFTKSWQKWFLKSTSKFREESGQNASQKY